MPEFEELYELLQTAENMSPGPLQVATLDRAVQIADVLKDLEWQLYARTVLISAAFSGGGPNEIFTAVTWCLGRIDQIKGTDFEQDLSLLLWQCKHVIAYAPSYLEISYKQFSDMLADVIRRYREFGASPRSVYMIACASEVDMGHFEKAEEYLEQFPTEPSDEFQETDEWELYVKARYLFQTGHQDEGFSIIEPMLEKPEIANDVDPWFASLSFVPLVRANRIDEALAHQRRTWSKIQGNPKFTGHFGSHFMVLALTGHLSKALSMFERSFEITHDFPTAGSRFTFYLESWFLMDRLMANGHTDAPVRIPKGVTIGPNDESCSVEEMSRWLESQFLKLADKFNERNGNSEFTRQIEEVRSYRELSRGQ